MTAAISRKFAENLDTRALEELSRNSELDVRNTLLSEFATELALEAKYFCSFVLGRAATDSLIRAYVTAHFKRPSNLRFDNLSLKTIISKQLDPVAIEFAMRPKFKVLGLKLNLICYIAENVSGFQDLFILEDRRRVSAFLKLASLVPKTPYQYLKGKYQVWRYDLV